MNNRIVKAIILFLVAFCWCVAAVFSVYYGKIGLGIFCVIFCALMIIAGLDKLSKK